MTLQAPFPWFGGKSRVADLVWSRLGNPTNYVEPFFGSGAVLLSRPDVTGDETETINDKDRFVANFWRAIAADPEAVARWVDWPVNEVDLTARHMWLLGEGARRIERCDGEPDWFDAQVAGWWCWGACSWIGGGWCSGQGPWSWDHEAHGWLNGAGGDGVTRQRPHLGSAGQGVNRQLPHLGGGWGVNRKRPHLGDAGQGVNRQLPHLGGAGRGVNRKLSIAEWFAALSKRLRRVRVTAGDWSRVTGDTVTWRHGMTGVFLDPPYADTAGRTADIYAQDSLTVAHDAREWAIAAGRNPLMRIAFAGYQGEHTFPPDWESVRWKAQGGYGAGRGGAGETNAGRETIWFSPHCLPALQRDLFTPPVDPEGVRMEDAWEEPDTIG